MLAVGIAATMAPIDAGSSYGASNCPEVMEFSTGGAAQPDGIRLGAMNKARPEGTARTKVRYSASISPVGGNISGAESTAEGERNLKRAARSFRARCPDSHIRLVGFSQGALVTGNVCNSFDSDPVMSRNTSCVLYSDPRRPDPVRPGVMAMLPSFVPGFPMMGARPETRHIPITQVCQSNDGICAAPNPVLDPIGFVNNLLGYLAYGAHGDYFAAPHSVDDGRLHTVRRSPYIPTADIAHPAPGVPTPYDVLDPVTSLLITPAPIATSYRPTPLVAYFPPLVSWLVPQRIGAVVLPPVNDVNALLQGVVQLVQAVTGTVVDVVEALPTLELNVGAGPDDCSPRRITPLPVTVSAPVAAIDAPPTSTAVETPRTAADEETDAALKAEAQAALTEAAAGVAAHLEKELAPATPSTPAPRAA
ncbi:hypothetical protein nbrc107696_38540 [Gordonia spumicola]|uniref:PE-PPE domain-containing protein n=2 Tax=Gordonia spumicola TaxID=589161 RepID=A0A7I9VDH4_9ACTN|nr:hypothetical protein nbrc107696_38540 [Gordonia spumicola]